MHPSCLLRPEVIWSCHNKTPPPLAAIWEARRGGCTKTELQDHLWLLAFFKMCRQHLTTTEGDFFSRLKCILGERYWSTGNCIALVSAGEKTLLLPRYWDGSSQLNLLFPQDRLCSFTMWFISSAILMEFVDFYNLISKSRQWSQLEIDPSKNY